MVRSRGHPGGLAGVKVGPRGPKFLSAGIALVGWLKPRQEWVKRYTGGGLVVWPKLKQV